MNEILDPRILRLLWSLGYAIPLVYAVTGWTVRWWTGPPVGTVETWWLLILWGAGAALTLMWAVAGRALQPPWQHLARWGIAETIAIVGLVALASGVSWPTFGVFLVWAAALHLLAAPPRPHVD